MNITIENLCKETVEFAHALESEYSNVELYGENDGFFIKAEEISLYHDLMEHDCLRIAKIDGTPAGQSMVIPPNHQILHRLFNANCMDFFNDLDVNPENSCWIAKIAVSMPYKRHGIGSMLVKDIEQRYSGFNILTTTALTPRMNLAIKGLMMSHQYKKSGVWVSGKENNHTCNILWHKKL